MRRLLLTAALAAACASAFAQKSAADGIAEYRAMLADGNPAELFEAKGEELWTKKRGPKNASLERCDLGKGPGVVKGAWVELPRWFPDTNKVQDLESRLLTCMETLQGLRICERNAFPRPDHRNARMVAAWLRRGCSLSAKRPEGDAVDLASARRGAAAGAAVRPRRRRSSIAGA